MRNATVVLTLALSMLLCACSERPVRYSEQIINTCIYDYKANTTDVAFRQFDAEGNLLADNAFGKDRLDYVPGLVAKAVIEAALYYQHEPFAAPWVYSIRDYANHFAAEVPTTGGSLDDLNAVKLYFALCALSGSEAAFADSLTEANCRMAIERARLGLKAHHEQYVIADSHPETAAHGGWWHKKNYINQMWCDGQYMGPALLAQIVAGGYGTITGSADEDWALIARQFEIAWHYLWDGEAELLWHAFSADGIEPNDITHAETWGMPGTLHSGTYWGRAEGWYFMALIDVLEQMQKADRMATPAYENLRAQLNMLASGLSKRQDEATGCWYQLLSENGTFSASVYNGQEVTPVSNYLESSCSFLFAAAYMKGARLGLFADNEAMRRIGERAYKGAMARFWDGEKLIDCCASAGLGGKGESAAAGGAKMRDGSRAYYLLGYDVTRITTYTEGKVLGAAIMAAVEYERDILP